MRVPVVGIMGAIEREPGAECIAYKVLNEISADV
jgi:hypothetical protein